MINTLKESNLEYRKWKSKIEQKSNIKEFLN